MDNFFIAFIILLASTFISQMLSEKALKKLPQEQKAGLIDLFSKNRIYNFSAIFGLIIIFFITIRFRLIAPKIANICYMIAIFGIIMLTNFFAYQKLKKHKFPAAFIKTYLISAVIRFVGMAIFFGLLFI